MDRHLQWKVISVVGYVAILMLTLVMGADGASSPAAWPILRLATPL
jgi:hypothetical protein